MKNVGAHLTELTYKENQMTQQSIVAGRGQRPGANKDPRLNWWRDAKFGMFIHWGLYCIPAGQWKGEDVPGIGEWIMLRAQIPVRLTPTLSCHERIAGERDSTIAAPLPQALFYHALLLHAS